jgi:hypothetical protein
MFSLTSGGGRRRRSDHDGDGFSDTKRSTHTRYHVFDALSAFEEGDLHDFKAILASYGASGRFKAEVMSKLQEFSNPVSQKLILTVLKLLLDYINPRRNVWLADVYSYQTGENGLLVAAHVADLSTMQCIIAAKITSIHSVSRHDRRGVLWTAVHYNKDLSTIKYLIGVLYASCPDNIPLNMYSALAGSPLVGGETLEKFLYLLDPTTQAEQTVDMLFHLSVAFRQHTILQHLFKCRLPTDMSALISRVCNLDDMETTKVMLGELDDCHSARLLKNALEADSIETLPAVIRSHYSRKMQLTFEVGMQMSSFLKLTAKHDNIIAWRLLLERWPEVWGAIRGVVYTALEASSVEYIDVLHERGHLLPPSAGSKRTHAQYLTHAVKHGCYKTVQWVIATLNPIIILGDLIKLAIPENNNDPLGLIFFYIDSMEHVDTDQEIFQLVVDAKRRNVMQSMYLNKKVDFYKCGQGGWRTYFSPCYFDTAIDEIFMCLLIHLRKHKQSYILPPVSGTEYRDHVEKPLNHMINFDAETRDRLEQALPSAVVAIIVDYGRSPCDAVSCVSFEVLE